MEHLTRYFNSYIVALACTSAKHFHGRSTERCVSVHCNLFVIISSPAALGSTTGCMLG